MKAALHLIILYTTCFCLHAVEKKPNIILIMADDLGYHDLGSYGHPKIKTPHLDKLASEGVRFTNYHSGATVCTPSRIALMTGSYPIRWGWEQGVAGYLMPSSAGLSEKAVTIAELFKKAGYATSLSGKWHIGNQPNTVAVAQGFDEFYGLQFSNNQTKKIFRDREVVEEPFENRLLTEKLSNEAIAMIERNKEEPFFLYLPFTAPHFPVESHPDWKGKSNFGEYGDVVEEMDARIGAIVAKLKKLELLEDTIIVFCSDNGPNPKEKADSLPFRGEKWSALEGGTRVPCILSWPGKMPKGKIYNDLSAAIDLLPTLCDMAKVDWSTNKKKIDGLSLWSSLQGKSDHPRNELLYWYGKSADPKAIRIGEWKLFFDGKYALDGSGSARRTEAQAQELKKYDLKKISGKPMLFHVEKDLGELHDVASKHPTKVKELTERADAIMLRIKEDGIIPIEKQIQK